MIVATTGAGWYEERTCLRCLDGRVYDMQRGAWVACERCSGTVRVVVSVYPKRETRRGVDATDGRDLGSAPPSSA